MKSFLIIGMGRFGRHILKKLDAMGYQTMAVDRDEEQIEVILPYATNAVIGDSTKAGFLRSLGVNDYDACIVAIGDDFQSSLETTNLLYELGAQYVIARATRGIHKKFLLNNGADEVVYPEKELAEWTAMRCSSRNIFDYIQLDDKYAIFEVQVPKKWCYKTLSELDIRKNFNFNILATKKKGVINPVLSPNSFFVEGDTILVLGESKKVHQYFHD